MKILISGIFGRMGNYVYKILSFRENIEVIGGIDVKRMYSKVPVFDNVCGLDYDILIDFSNSTAAYFNVMESLKNSKMVLCGTTGFTNDELNNMINESKNTNTSLIICPNFAFLASIMYKIIEEFKDFFQDIDLIETHHLKKKDAPSGTSIDYAKILNLDKSRIQSVRVNNLIATHELIVNKNGERLIIKHEILSRDAFLTGFLNAIDTLILKKDYICVTSLKEYYEMIRNM